MCLPPQFRHVLFWFVLDILFLGGFFNSLGAAIYPVTPNGTGTGSLQGALNVVNPGDTVMLENGTFTPSSTPIISRSGTSSAPITIQARNPGQAILSGQPFAIQASWINFLGITIDGKKTAGSEGLLAIGHSSSPTSFVLAGNILIDGVTLLNAGGSLLQISLGIHDVIVRNSTANGGGYRLPYGDAIYLGFGSSNPPPYCENIEIYNCNFNDFTEAAIGSHPGVRNVKIHDCNFTNLATYASHGISSTRYASAMFATGVEVYRCKFQTGIGNSIVRIGFSAGASNIHDNIFDGYSVSDYAIDSTYPDFSPLTQNNSFTNCTKNNVRSGSGVTVTGNCGINFSNNQLTCGTLPPSPPIVQPPIIVSNQPPIVITSPSGGYVPGNLPTLSNQPPPQSSDGGIIGLSIAAIAGILLLVVGD